MNGHSPLDWAHFERQHDLIRVRLQSLQYTADSLQKDTQSTLEHVDRFFNSLRNQLTVGRLETPPNEPVSSHPIEEAPLNLVFQNAPDSLHMRKHALANFKAPAPPPLAHTLSATPHVLQRANSHPSTSNASVPNIHSTSNTPIINYSPIINPPSSPAFAQNVYPLHGLSQVSHPLMKHSISPISMCPSSNSLANHSPQQTHLNTLPSVNVNGQLSIICQSHIPSVPAPSRVPFTSPSVQIAQPNALQPSNKQALNLNENPVPYQHFAQIPQHEEGVAFENEGLGQQLVGDLPADHLEDVLPEGSPGEGVDDNHAKDCRCVEHDHGPGGEHLPGTPLQIKQEILDDGQLTEQFRNVTENEEFGAQQEEQSIDESHLAVLPPPPLEVESEISERFVLPEKSCCNDTQEEEEEEGNNSESINCSDGSVDETVTAKQASMEAVLEIETQADDIPEVPETVAPTVSLLPPDESNIIQNNTDSSAKRTIDQIVTLESTAPSAKRPRSSEPTVSDPRNEETDNTESVPKMSVSTNELLIDSNSDKTRKEKERSIPKTGKFASKSSDKLKSSSSRKSSSSPKFDSKSTKRSSSFKKKHSKSRSEKSRDSRSTEREAKKEEPEEEDNLQLRLPTSKKSIFEMKIPKKTSLTSSRPIHPEFDADSPREEGELSDRTVDSNFRPAPGSSARWNGNQQRRQFNIRHLCCPISGCPLTFSFIRDLETHLVKQHQRGPWLCHQRGCEKRFYSPNALHDHQDREHLDLTEWECAYCDQRTDADNLHFFEIHYLFEHQRGLFACNRTGCTFTSETRGTTYKHFASCKATDQSDARTHSPPPVPAYSRSKWVLDDDHYDKYKTNNLVCWFPRCGEILLDEADLEKHLTEEHRLLFYRCAVSNCGRSFETSFKLNQHSFKEHRSPDFNCFKCPKVVVFIRPNELRKHNIEFHHEGTFACRKCNYPEKYRYKILEHYHTKHPS